MEGFPGAVFCIHLLHKAADIAYISMMRSSDKCTKRCGAASRRRIVPRLLDSYMRPFYELMKCSHEVSVASFEVTLRMQEWSLQRPGITTSGPYTRPVSPVPASVPARRMAGSTSFLCAAENE